MSKMKKVIMVAMIVLISCALVVMSTTVKATDSALDISGDLNISTGNATTANTTNGNITPSMNTTGNSDVIQPVTSNTTEGNSTTDTLPQTGVTEDITVMFFIVVCTVSAIYAYKKIRDYKNM